MRRRFAWRPSFERLTVFDIVIGVCTIIGLVFSVATHYGWL